LLAKHVLSFINKHLIFEVYGTEACFSCANSSSTKISASLGDVGASVIKLVKMAFVPCLFFQYFEQALYYKVGFQIQKLNVRLNRSSNQ
jgi:hypothetical protein